MLPHEDNVSSAEKQQLDLAGENLVLPLHVEEITVAKRQIERSIVRVATTTNLVDRIVEEDLVQERVEIERIPIGHYVDVFPPVREEGDLTIMPVVEEVLVVERRYLLKEEVHIRRICTAERHRETVQLREQEAIITRTSSVISNPGVTTDPVQRHPNIHQEEELK